MYKIKCCMCDKPAKWEQSTQFTGDRHYCKTHAKAEPDFKQDSSYAYWHKIQRKLAKPNANK